ncbi:MAG: plastocyanin/azurin family copper-binding protein, partial [Halobacteriota archaeon]
PLLNTGDTYTYQFNNSGSFPYHCSIHPYMKGTIVVE